VIARLAAIAAIVAVALALGSCSVSDYCLNCATNDGPGGDGGVDANGDAPDSGTPADACVPTSTEICDNIDNDCNGMIDDDPAQVGDECGDPDPPCSLGVYECNAGLLECTGVEPTPESCDDIDNNCNGTVDEGDPEGGGTCGSDLGECVAGVFRCQGGDLVCIGSIGTPGMDPETCDGQDDDCDGTFDEGIVLGSCGLTDEGECTLGTEQCSGGGIVCIGATYPTFEICDNFDQDCDGNDTNGYDLLNDRQNCGSCGNVCVVMNASAVCSGGECLVGTCDPDFHDANGDGNMPGTDGCEYGPCEFQSTQEACNLADDDCDTMIDEGVSPPPSFCSQVGACMGSTPTCTANGWVCSYGPDVSTDGMGNIIPESTCDGIDNDCDGPIDESHPLKNQPCNDGQAGACTDFGTFGCDTGDPAGPLVCSAVDDDGGTGTAEVCNGIDDNCDSTVDNGFAAGMMTGQDFVTLGGTQIMKYEASRPSATSTSQGTGGTYVCSRANVVPWTNVTRPQAQAACAAIGARLCTEAEWQTACYATTQAFPITGPTGANDRVFMEAEDGTNGGAIAGKSWTSYTGTTGFSGTGALQATPDSDSGTVNCGTANPDAATPRVDFQVNVQSTGNYFIWVRMIRANGSGSDDSVCVGVDNVQNGTTLTTTNGTWTWVVSGAINVATTGNHRFSVYMREDGTAFDAIAVSKNGVDAPIEHQYTWAFDVNPTLPQPNKCNTDPYDTVAGGADQDDILATGTLTACFANGSGANDAFDLTGNVREWTAPRSPGVNAMRGGASNTELNGAACQDDFVLGNDTFFFPNVGFRCCR
jgi:hypothetical protein